MPKPRRAALPRLPHGGCPSWRSTQTELRCDAEHTAPSHETRADTPGTEAPIRRTWVRLRSLAGLVKLARRRVERKTRRLEAGRKHRPPLRHGAGQSVQPSGATCSRRSSTPAWHSGHVEPRILGTSGAAITKTTWQTSREHVTSTESSEAGIRALDATPPERRRGPAPPHGCVRLRRCRAATVRTKPKPAALSAVDQLAAVLDSPEIAALVSAPEATRWTGRPGYPIRSMVGMALAKSIYAVPTWTRTVALVSEHAALRAAITRGTPVPSVHACYRFRPSCAHTATCSPRALTA